MKTIQITRNGNIYSVETQPNWIESVFGVKAKTHKYYNTGKEYAFGLGNVFVDENNNILNRYTDIQRELDLFIQKESLNKNLSAEDIIDIKAAREMFERLTELFDKIDK